ncbi:MAG TPA: sigma factor-like helix-turn-helix DNA-binding protein [Candidatus Dormibacteraeota bacterium]|jgi:hypothetical protein|nr:sigma factor-like helix-turn-helix DNA-binding protein [Candidatus Dormibacteraeota bacterium]
MSLDTLASRDQQIGLLERYGKLLTDRQRRALELHWVEDWSISEIADSQGTSRAAAHDLIRRASATLIESEERLGLLAEDRSRRDAVIRLGAEVSGLQKRLRHLELQLSRL